MDVLIADDHSIVRMGLRLLIEGDYPGVCIHEADNGGAVMEKAKQNNFDLITLDFQMPNTDIFSLVSYLLARDEEVKILVYTMAPEKLYAPKLFAAGVRGFLSKEAENSEVLKAFQTLLAGRVYGNKFMETEAASVTATTTVANPFSVLSAKELDILNFLLQGKNTKEISTLSHLQMSTISTHKVRIFRKLNVANMVELLALTREYKL